MARVGRTIRRLGHEGCERRLGTLWWLLELRELRLRVLGLRECLCELSDLFPMPPCRLRLPRRVPARARLVLLRARRGHRRAPRVQLLAFRLHRSERLGSQVVHLLGSLA